MYFCKKINVVNSLQRGLVCSYVVWLCIYIEVIIIGSVGSFVKMMNFIIYMDFGLLLVCFKVVENFQVIFFMLIGVYDMKCFYWGENFVQKLIIFF